jgi:amino acid permease
MGIDDLISKGVDFFKTEPIIAIVVIAIIAVLFYFKKKAMFRILAIFLVFALLYYFVTLIGGMTFGGKAQKETLIERSQQ